MQNRLREFRTKKGLMQIQLADEIGCKQGTVAHYENGLCHPSLYVAIRLARALNTTVEELFEGEVDG